METEAGPAAEAPSAERAWWLRTLAVFTSPRTTFAAMRDGSRQAFEAREEPVLALMILSGVAGVLATPFSGDLLDNEDRDGIVVAVIVFLAGGMYGAATYWIGGGALALGIRAAGGHGTYRLARHVLAYAAAPLALSLLLVWPLRLAVHGGDLFREGGSDDSGAGRWVFEALELGFFAWAAVLLAVGVRTVHDWPLVRTLGALALALLALVCFALFFSLL